MKGSEKMQELINAIIGFIKIIFTNPVLLTFALIGFFRIIIDRKRRG